MKIRDIFSLALKNIKNGKNRVITTTVSLTMILTVVFCLAIMIDFRRADSVSEIEKDYKNTGTCINVQNNINHNNESLTTQNYDDALELISSKGLDYVIDDLTISLKSYDRDINAVFFENFDKEIIAGEGFSRENINGIWISQSIYGLLNAGLGVEIGDDISMPVNIGYVNRVLNGKIIGVYWDGGDNIYMHYHKLIADKDIFGEPGIKINITGSNMSYTALQKLYIPLDKELIKINESFSVEINGQIESENLFNTIVLLIGSFLVVLLLGIGINSMVGSVLISVAENNKTYSLFRLLGIKKKTLFIISVLEFILITLTAVVISFSAVLIVKQKLLVSLINTILFISADKVIISWYIPFILFSAVILLAVGLIGIKIRKYYDYKLLSFLREE